MPSIQVVRAAACAFVAAVSLGCASDDPSAGGVQEKPQTQPPAGPATPTSPAATPPSSTPASMPGIPSSSAAGSAAVPMGDTASSQPSAAAPDPNLKPASTPPMAESTPKDGIGADGKIVAACRGFAFDGLRYSPGGSVLPNTCAPFNRWTNNPYAVRCIDGLPNYKTPFPGDDHCILPPPPELGFQVGVHPGGNVTYWDKLWAGDNSIYADSASAAGYEVAAGGEVVQNYDAVLKGPTNSQFFYRVQFRGRYGSHHGMVRFTASTVSKDAWQNNGNLSFDGAEIITPQNVITDVPQSTLDISPEEDGIGFPIAATGVFFNLHHFNTSDKPILREIWVNAWYVAADKVTRQAQYFTSSAAVNYPPGMVIDNTSSVRATSKTQILSLFGHRHGWTTRFSAWVVRSGSTTQELVYDSYDWNEMPTFAYNSTTKNEPPGTPSKDGATSGSLVLQAGDTLGFNCHAETTQKRADELGVPMPTTTLRTANEAFTGEMCIVNGHTVGGTLGFSF
jgi:hypothetical protein